MSRTDTREIKIMNLEIMLINSNKNNLFPKYYDMEAWLLMSVLDVIYQRFVYMLLLQIEYCSWFMIWSDIYCFLFWVGRWYLLSTRALYWPLLLLFSSCLIVECSKRAVIFDSTVIQASLRHTGSSGWANASSLDWISSFMSWCLEPPARTSFLCIFSF